MSLRVLPGRVAVLLSLAERSEMLIRVPEWVRRAGEQTRADALQGRRGTVLDSGFPGLRAGDQVAVRDDAACLALEPKDYDFVPEGFEVRIYGVHEDVLDRSPRGDPDRGQDVVMWVER